ncbi:hypothetical protein B0J14DRAFT_560642 [Halenospora varia]|nr:hypothetical protein B0J14DRAFT_560642 [Halenospora varia]
MQTLATSSCLTTLLLTIPLLTPAHSRNIATPPPDDAVSVPNPSILPRSPISPVGLSLPIILPGPPEIHQTTTITIHSTVTRTSTVHDTGSATSLPPSLDPIETTPDERILFAPGLFGNYRGSCAVDDECDGWSGDECGC